MATIDQFKAQLIGGGPRANRFRVFIPRAGEKIEFLCTAAQIPSANINTLAVPFRGQVLKLAGDRTFEPWTITVMNDTDFKLYRGFERWMNGINNMTDNEGIANPADYQVDGFIDHLDRNGNTLKSYTYRGLFPIALDSIPLNYNANDTIEEFGVTFQFQYFETDTTT